MAKITKTFVDGCTPADKDRIEWDDDLKGFGIKVFVTGTKSFIFDYRNPEGTKRRVTIGKLSTALTPDQARKRAIELYRQGLISFLTRTLPALHSQTRPTQPAPST